MAAAEIPGGDHLEWEDADEEWEIQCLDNDEDVQDDDGGISIEVDHPGQGMTTAGSDSRPRTKPAGVESTMGGVHAVYVHVNEAITASCVHNSKHAYQPQHVTGWYTRRPQPASKIHCVAHMHNMHLCLLSLLHTGKAHSMPATLWKRKAQQHTRLR